MKRVTMIVLTSNSAIWQAEALKWSIGKPLVKDIMVTAVDIRVFLEEPTTEEELKPLLRSLKNDLGLRLKSYQYE